ncbi:MAG: DNA internalization-related competence protein ComEC/Rec2 [Lachnospiraceae bacterium]|nr:DNA internalization-related competence protein ComEC/Rec2 [Lachnospiraceae bacterium]
MAGVYGACRCGPPLTAMFTGLCLAAGLILLCADIFRKRIPLKRMVFYLSVWSLIVLFVLTGYERTCTVLEKSPLKTCLDRSVQAKVHGTVTDISLRTDGYLITISNSNASFDGDTFDSEKIHLYTDNRIEANGLIGSKITAEGRLYPFEAATNPGQFDSDAYYSARKVDAKMYVSEVAVSGSDAYSASLKLYYGLLNMLCGFRMRVSKGLYSVLPEKEAGTLSAMLLGERGLIDSDIRKLYSQGGIAHILSISALHVTLIGMGLFRLVMLITKNRRTACAATVVISVTYCIMTGSSVSTVRAVAMLCVNMLGKFFLRAYDDVSGCAFSGLLILAKQPLYMFDAGTQLSFTAVLGIIVMKWLIEKQKIKNPFLLAFLPCLSVFIFTMPVVMNTYYEISVYSLLINPVILVFMTMLLVSGMICGTLTAVWASGMGAALFFAGPVYYILRLYEEICEFETELPFSKIVTGAPTHAGVIVYYLALVFAVYVLIKIKKKQGLLLLAACCVIFIRQPGPSVEIDFLDVGQGDCAYMCREGVTILSDGGSSNVSNVARYRIIPFLKYKGVHRLDTVMISHLDADHINGIIEMLKEGYPRIGCIIVPYNADKGHEVFELARNSGIKVEWACSGEKYGEDGRISVLAPDMGRVYKDGNEGSLVAQTCLKDFGVLFTGDSGADSEAAYAVKTDAEKVTVLKTPHHGSKYSSSRKLLDLIHPVVAVISCSKYNTYGHPAPETLERLEKTGTTVFTTPECGMVSVSYDGGKVFRVRTFKEKEDN